MVLLNNGKRDFLIDNIFVRFGGKVFRQVIGIPMVTNSAPSLADLFLHTYEYEFIKKKMKGDITRALQLNKTFRHIDDLLCVNNDNFNKHINEIYPLELILKNILLHLRRHLTLILPKTLEREMEL